MSVVHRAGPEPFDPARFVALTASFVSSLLAAAALTRGNDRDPAVSAPTAKPARTPVGSMTNPGVVTGVLGMGGPRGGDVPCEPSPVWGGVRSHTSAHIVRLAPPPQE
jgi:hypothetical protein